jgi:asparagine synthase (glutamine-hydrolysing)
VSAFTVSFKGDTGDQLDETSLSRSVAKRYGLDHHIIEVSPSFVDIADELTLALDEPFADDTIIPSYYVYKAAAKYVKTALSGLGGDELFSGYLRHLGIRFSSFFDMYPGRLVSPFLKKALGLYSNGMTGRRSSLVTRFAESLNYTEGRRYQQLSCLGSSAIVDSILNKKRPIDANAFQILDGCYFNRYKGSYIEKALYQDIKLYAADDTLVASDRLSMWHSLELRVPLFDRVLVERAAQLPSRLKSSGVKLKVLLKKIALKHLPEGIINHRKQGFESPMRSWLRSDLSDYVSRLLMPERLNKHELFSAASISRLVGEHRYNKGNHEKMLFALVMFQLWYENVYQGHSGQLNL